MRKLLLLAILFLPLRSNVLNAQTVLPKVQISELGTKKLIIKAPLQLNTNMSDGQQEVLKESLVSCGLLTTDEKAKKSLDLVLVPSLPCLEHPEAYMLTVDKYGVHINACTEVGIFYGVQTLAQILETNEKGDLELDYQDITDYPTFDYRGLMLDVSRHFRSVEFVKKQIDALARYKMNTLHLHLTDAAGWRLEISRYPELTSVTAWREGADWKEWWNELGRKYSYEGSPSATGGYYTKDQMRELIAYAAQRHVTIIPEIEMPAHSDEVMAVYPELSCAGVPYKTGDLCVGNEQTFEFLTNVLDEVIELFPSQYIHIGGDEAGKQEWASCPKCKARMEAEGLECVDELQSYLIHRIEKYLNSKGRDLLGWDEILDGGLAPNATVMSWRGTEGGLKAIGMGHKVIMSPGAYCYFDSYQDAPHTQPEALGGYLPLEKVYSYNPTESLSAEQAELLLGVQGNLWTEYVPTEEHAEYMIYPRVLAIAEIGWTAQQKREWTDFSARVAKENKYLKEQGYNTFNLDTEVGNRKEASEHMQHKALGKKVIYNAPYNSSYASKGDTALVDGERGGWTYSDGKWQGFISAERFDVTIDLDVLTDISEISADFMQVVGPQVYLPVEVIISVSTDGVNYTELKRVSSTVDLEKPVDFINHSWKGTAKARFVRYQAKSSSQHGGWIFTDEVVVK